MNHCVFCGGQEKVSENKLKEQLTKIASSIKEYKEKNIKNIEISGCDLGNYPALPKLIKYLKDEGFSYIKLSTNGLNLADKKFADDLIEAGLDIVRIPLYGPKKNHDAIVQNNGAFTAVMQALKNLSGKIKIQISSLIMEQNKKVLVEIIKLAKNAKANSLYFSVPCLYTTNANDYSNTLDYYIPVKNRSKFIRVAFEHLSKLPVGFIEIPYCVFGKMSDRINNLTFVPDMGECQPQNPHNSHVMDIPNYRLKSKEDICKSCKANSKCDGFFLNDVKRFGTGNLEPI